MSDWDDLEGVTHPRISNEEAERLVTGATSGDEARNLADLSAVFQALRQPAEPAELAGLNAVLATFDDAVVTMHTDLSTARTRPMIKKLLTGKALAAIGAITLVSAGAAAAAGVVPSPFSASRPSAATAQKDASDDTDADDTDADDTAVDTTPTTDSADATDSAATDDSTDGTESQGPDVNGPAKFGLCTAYQARTKHDATTDSTPTESTATSSDDDSGEPPPFQALNDAAVAAGQTVEEFCADATPGGSDDAPGHSGDNPSVTAPGKSGDNPSATAPGKSDDNPSVTAPGKSGDNPSVTAPGRSGGDHGKPTTTQP